MTGGAVVVVPCYNEADRLDVAAFRSLVHQDAALALLFVNDGSTDHTEQRLGAVRAQCTARCHLLSLARNVGKAEAVRAGLLRALDMDAEIVGYVDADLATPASELLRLLSRIRGGAMDVLLGARVSLLGRDIRRSARRHYLGRLFATAASAALGLSVYDTQCGAKLFRRTPALAGALESPFLSRWAFDVELLGRIVVGGPGAAGVDRTRIVEEPLLVWRDVPGSKLRTGHMVGAAVDMMRIAIDLARRRRMAREAPSVERPRLDREHGRSTSSVEAGRPERRAEPF